MTSEIQTKKPWFKTWWGILIILAFWPISLSYWIWKQNWNKNLKVGLITFIWGFIFVVFLSSATFQAGYKAGREASVNQSSNIIQTAVPTHTPIILPTKLNPTQFIEDTAIKTTEDNSKAATKYASSMISLFNQQTKSSEGITNGLKKWPDLTSQEIVALAADTVILEGLYDKALEIDPPKELTLIHNKYLNSFKLMKEAMPILRNALDNQDADLFNQVTVKIKKATSLMDEATQELISLTKK